MSGSINISEYRELKDLRLKCREQELEINLLQSKIRSLEERLEGTELIIEETEEVFSEDVKTPQRIIIQRLFDGAKFSAILDGDFVVCESENIRVLNDEKALDLIGYKLFNK